MDRLAGGMKSVMEVYLSLCFWRLSPLSRTTPGLGNGIQVQEMEEGSSWAPDSGTPTLTDA